jgi:hypothetical protein
MCLVFISCKDEVDIFGCAPIPCAGQEIEETEIRIAFFNQNGEALNIESIIDKNEPYVANDSVKLYNPVNGEELNLAIFPPNGNDIVEPQLRIFLAQWDISIPYLILSTPFGTERNIRLNISSTPNACECYTFEWDKRLIVNQDTLSPITGGILTYELIY